MANVDSPDWLNLAPTGNGSVLSSGSVAVPSGGAGFTSTPFPTYGFEDLVVQTNPGVGSWAGRWQVTFYTDALGTNPVYTTPLTRFNTVNLHMTQQVPVLGPYATIAATQTTGANQNFQYTIFGLVNAVGVAPVVPPQTVINQQAQALAANGQNIYTPTLLCPGKYRLWANSNQTIDAAVTKFNGISYDVIMQISINPANGQDGNYDFAAPIDEWRVAISNLTANAATIYCAVTGPY